MIFADDACLRLAEDEGDVRGQRVQLPLRQRVGVPRVARRFNSVVDHLLLDLRLDRVRDDAIRVAERPRVSKEALPCRLVLPWRSKRARTAHAHVFEKVEASRLDCRPERLKAREHVETAMRAIVDDDVEPVALWAVPGA